MGDNPKKDNDKKETKNRFFSPLINLSIIKAVTIILVALIAFLTVFYSLNILSDTNNSNLCEIITPFEGKPLDHSCTNNNEAQADLFSNLNTIPENRYRDTYKSELINFTDLQDIPNNLMGNWSFSGYNRGNILYAEVDLGSNDSYSSTGRILFDNREFIYNESGKYKINTDRIIFYSIGENKIQSIYLLDNVRENSFYASNPNSLESYTFKRLAF